MALSGAGFDRRQPLCAIQFINILSLSSQYNHVHVVLQNLDLKALSNLLEQLGAALTASCP
ncbi:MAG TPA: hypothetical protein VH369_26515 [Bryobacteraceae bacterium]|jgi:hypothetical protein